MATIKSEQVHSMVNHWLHTPSNSYLGSSYGQTTNSLLQRPQSSNEADEWINKLRDDILVLQSLPLSDTNLYAVKTPPDKLQLIIEVAGRDLTVPGV